MDAPRSRPSLWEAKLKSSY